MVAGLPLEDVLALVRASTAAIFRTLGALCLSKHLAAEDGNLEQHLCVPSTVAGMPLKDVLTLIRAIPIFG
jgi:hypothetical protein